MRVSPARRLSLGVVRLMQSKPMSVRVLAVVLVVVASLFAVTSAMALSFVAASVSCIGAIGAGGLFSNDPRSRFVVYSASAVVSLSWLALIAELAFSGWPVRGFVQSFISLVPGLLLLTICIGCALLAARYSGEHA